MPQHWPATVVLAVVSAFVTTMMLEGVVKPRLERRNQRIKAAQASRDALSTSMLAILSAGAKLSGFEAPTSASDTVRARMREEQERWYSQIDGATRDLIDGFHTFTLTYAGLGGLRDLLLRYVFTARGVMLSERNRRRKAELLVQLTGPAWTLFFGARWWDPRSPLAVMRNRAELLAKLDEIEAPEAEPGQRLPLGT